jgi:hypothetical protein
MLHVRGFGPSMLRMTQRCGLGGGLLAVIYGRSVRALRKTFQDRLAEASRAAEESVGNMRTVRYIQPLTLSVLRNFKRLEYLSTNKSCYK